MSRELQLMLVALSPNAASSSGAVRTRSSASRVLVQRFPYSFEVARCACTSVMHEALPHRR